MQKYKVDQLRINCNDMTVKPELTKEQIADIKRIIKEMLTTYNETNEPEQPRVYFNTTEVKKKSFFRWKR
jgi:hypothetical protein